MAFFSLRHIELVQENKTFDGMDPDNRFEKNEYNLRIGESFGFYPQETVELKFRVFIHFPSVTVVFPVKVAVVLKLTEQGSCEQKVAESLTYISIRK